MQEVIRLEDQHYILATSSRIVERTHVLKEGDTFAVFGPRGDVASIGTGTQGLYHNGTRFLSLLELRLNEQRPVLLGSTIRQDNHTFGADLTNPDVVSGETVVLPRDLVHVFRSRFLWDRCCYERLRVMNYGLEPIELRLAYEFDADFRDIFEVRGMRRNARGRMLRPEIEGQDVVLAYEGLDGVLRTTRLSWNVAPEAISGGDTVFRVHLAREGCFTLSLAVECIEGRRPSTRRDYDAALGALVVRDGGLRREFAVVETSNSRFNEWIHRSAADVRMMISDTASGRYPYAGVPWFSTVFGRDGLITALSLLWVNPAVAAGVLKHLAATQATAVRPEQDAEPGKVLHESRGGEMAALGEVPFGRYYGSVDATPLFVLLAGLYFRRTADLALIESIWPNIEMALGWIDRYGDLDGDGFVEYARRSETGLAQQGWKDSQDSVFHADGTLAPAPIALCEVQGYVFDAKLAAADLAERLGHADMARRLRESADVLRDRFQRAFWCDELGTYALALDGVKRPCRVRTSNAGHCLFTGIVPSDRAQRMIDGLWSAENFSGWGIRTLASSEARYNPMSYHNGSIWPHDNALIAAGCARYGYTDTAAMLASAMFEASASLELQRLPELFCGFHRREGEPPTPYPVACAPQAWSAATVFLLLQSCLGLSIDAASRRVGLRRPRLPDAIDRLAVRNLQVAGEASIDVQFERRGNDVSTMVLRKDPGIELSVLK